MAAAARDRPVEGFGRSISRCCWSSSPYGAARPVQGGQCAHTPAAGRAAVVRKILQVPPGGDPRDADDLAGPGRRESVGLAQQCVPNGDQGLLGHAFGKVGSGRVAQGGQRGVDLPLVDHLTPPGRGLREAGVVEELRAQGGERERLHHVLQGSSAHCRPNRLQVAGGGQHHHVRTIGDLLKGVGDLQPVHPRHCQVEQH